MLCGYGRVSCVDHRQVADSLWWVYVVQSLEKRPGNKPGFFYVGCTTDPCRRIRQHNGEIQGGGKYTAKHRPWVPRALYGPYVGQTEAMKAEYALKHGKRGTGRIAWTVTDSKWCRGLGPAHPWVASGGVRLGLD